MSYDPVIIIGAPRSGTNMLRDVLTSIKGISTWPCDEINYVWRHGNLHYGSDEFTNEMATPEVKDYVNRQFDWVARRYDAHTVVEKTCANSLRVGFVDQVVPDAKYVFIRRDGLDVVGSARLRWTAALDIPYLLQKARFVPFADLPFHASRYLWSRAYRTFSKEKRLAFWGPKLEDMDKLLQEYSLEQICAIQWQRCVENAEEAFSRMPEHKVIEVGYEAFVTSPEEELGRITNFLGLDVDEGGLHNAVAGISSRSVGKGRQSLSEKDIMQLMPLMKKTMDKYEYR